VVLFVAKEMAAMFFGNHCRILIDAKEDLNFEFVIIHVRVYLWYLLELK
jgi:hypothetical protein